MAKVDEYRARLRALKNWIPYLRKESGLPGPRGNLELAAAAALEADSQQVRALLSIPAKAAPENSPGVFLLFCGVVALGRQIAAGDRGRLAELRQWASDPRWRIREAVAIALQYLGESNLRLLIREMNSWSSGNFYEQRAAAAALAEPRLLKDAAYAADILAIFDRITGNVQTATQRRDDAFRTLRQTMGYAWSVIVAAYPRAGKPRFEKWLRSSDGDVRWMLKDNLKKKRLVTMDPAWVQKCLDRLGA
jgi:hypothetical protein